MLDRLRAVIDLRRDEGPAALWAGVGFAAVLGSYFLLRPVRDAFGIEGDPSRLPWLFTATFVAMLVVAAPWGALVARAPRRLLVPISYRAFVVQLLGFAALVGWNVAPDVVGKVFYVWLSVFNLFVVSVFWSTCAELARPEQGRRLFGPIAAGGTAGAIVGPLITRSLATEVEPWVLLVIAAALLEAAVWAIAAVERHGRRLAAATDAGADGRTSNPPAPSSPAIVGGHPLRGLANLTRSPYLAGIAAYALCAAILATFVYLQQAEIARAALPDRATRTRFFADVDLWTNLATILLQLALVSRLLRWLGPGIVLAALPLVQAAGIVGLTLAPGLVMATAVSASGRAATHALSRPARELLFTAVSREDRYKTKNVIDTLVYRFGDFGSSWLHRGLAAAGVALTAVALPLAAAWVVLALGLGVGHRRRARTPSARTDHVPGANTNG